MISSKAAFTAAISAVSAVSVLSLTGCGSSAKSAAAAPSAATTSAPSAAASSTTASAADLPSGVELAASVAVLISPTTPPSARAAKVIGGGDLTPTLTKLDAYLKDFKVVFKVSGQEMAGSTLKGNVQIISNGKPFPKLYPAFWQQGSGSWQLTRSGACSLIAVSGITCPDAAVS